MTPLNGKPLVRETGRYIRGRALVVEMFAGYVSVRRKGTRLRYSVAWDQVHDLGAKLLARERAAERKARKGKGT